MCPRLARTFDTILLQVAGLGDDHPIGKLLGIPDQLVSVTSQIEDRIRWIGEVEERQPFDQMALLETPEMLEKPLGPVVRTCRKTRGDHVWPGPIAALYA